jgi:hypothetical protein
MPNVVSAIDGTSHEIQIPSNDPQQKTYFQQTNYFRWLATEFYDYTLSINLPMLNLKLCQQLKH